MESKRIVRVISPLLAAGGVTFGLSLAFLNGPAAVGHDAGSKSPDSQTVQGELRLASGSEGTAPQSVSPGRAAAPPPAYAPAPPAAAAPAPGAAPAPAPVVPPPPAVGSGMGPGGLYPGVTTPAPVPLPPATAPGGPGVAPAPSMNGKGDGPDTGHIGTN
ncbi:hypothetical protein [Nocardia wallacei]|uniref:hypothetical protein n=1 Tax=Nocardia wallacei TaxID=480035 RepID=UPI0024572AAD|nr:hypothetical protein [Nocardia wallacei]